MKVAQLMCCIPGLKRPEGIHLPKGAEQGEGCSEDSEPCSEVAFGTVVRIVYEGVVVLPTDGAIVRKLVLRCQSHV